MKPCLRVLAGVLSATLISPPFAAAEAASSDAPFVAVAAAWQDAWNRHDMDALANVVAQDIDRWGSTMRTNANRTAAS
jgi:hypothetical protein